MSGMAASTSQVTLEHAQKQSDEKKGRLARMESKKKYMLIAFASVGVTLLVTGATGPRLLKRLQRIGGGATTTTTSSIEAVPAKVKRVRLKDLAASSSFSVDLKKAHYFSTNSAIIDQSTAWAQKVEEQDKLFVEGSEEMKEQAALDDGFNPATFALKAFAIATAIVASLATASVYALMRYYDIDDVRDLGLALSQSLSPRLERTKPELPAWARPRDSVDIGSVNEQEEEELSYWAQLRESLDKEAAEDKLRKKREWDAKRAAT